MFKAKTSGVGVVGAIAASLVLLTGCAASDPTADAPQTDESAAEETTTVVVEFNIHD